MLLQIMAVESGLSMFLDVLSNNNSRNRHKRCSLNIKLYPTYLIFSFYLDTFPWPFLYPLTPFMFSFWPQPFCQYVTVLCLYVMPWKISSGTRLLSLIFSCTGVLPLIL